MESSYHLGGSEECNSCESGWTMYIASPMNGDDDASDDSGEDNGDDGGGASDDNSDDSMASDASSGPSHLERFCGVGREIDSSEDDDGGEDEEDGDEGGGDCSGYTQKRSYKRAEKSRGRMEVKKKSPIHLERKTDDPCTSSKVRKTDSIRKAN